ncbi:MAG: type II secretion system F family protein [candidate division WOR-3 bacterium]|nr:type II secretion system F family protein [candidate division WOR-3 bacterium]
MQVATTYRRRFLARTEEQVVALYLGVSPERLWLYTLLGATAGALLMALVSNFRPLMVAAGAAAGFMVPRLYLNNTEQRRRRKFDAQLLEAIPMLAGAMKAGMSLLQAMEQITREMGPPIRQEFAHALQENRVGKPLMEALNDMKNRLRTDDLSITVDAVGISQETGGVLSEVLMKIAETIKSRNRVRTKIDTLTAQGRLQGIIMSLMPWGLAAILFLLDPELMRPMFTTGTGQIILVAIVILEIMGWLVIRRLVSIDV